jgi:formamidopyrimidine-DNA glycosylase
LPELPEVETTVRGIAPHICFQRVTTVVVREPRLRWPIPPDLSLRLPGAEVLAVHRRAKYICIETSVGGLIAHLGMSGSFRVCSPAAPLKSHDHLLIRLGSTELRYHDPRRFGCVLWESSNRAQALLASLGPEPLSEAFHAAYLKRVARGRAVPVKQFIMTNQVVVGVGNIYASESLFMAGIRPTLPASRVSLPRYGRLVEAIQTVLTRSIDAGGTTLRDFVNGQGEPGYFQQTLAVYGRQGSPCLQCARPIEKINLGGRSTYFCRACQRLAS